MEELLGISVLPLQSEDSTPGATGHLFPRPADSSLRTFTDKHRRQSTGSFWMCPGIRQRLLGLEPTCLLCMHGAGVDSVLTRVSPVDGTSKEKQSLKSYSGGCVAAATVNTGLIY